MTMTAEHDFASALDKMERFAWSRNRAADREPRTIALTDDEAVAVLEWIHEMAPPTEGDDE